MNCYTCLQKVNKSLKRLDTMDSKCRYSATSPSSIWLKNANSLSLYCHHVAFTPFDHIFIYHILHILKALVLISIHILKYVKE